MLLSFSFRAESGRCHHYSYDVHESKLVKIHWLTLFFPSIPLEFPIKPLAVCNFNDGETCGWMHEEATWAHRWAVRLGSLCLTAMESSFSKGRASWLPGVSVGRSTDANDITVRFTSPPVPATVGLNCIAFVYSMNLGREKKSKSTKSVIGLSLLQQQKGCLFHS